MPSAYGKRPLSGSTNYRQIKVAATATAGTLIHTGVSGTSDSDEVYLQATNNDTVSRTVTLEWGGVSSPDDLFTITLPAKSGLTPLVKGNCIQNGLVIRAFASAANVVCIQGYVNRITA